MARSVGGIYSYINDALNALRTTANNKVADSETNAKFVTTLDVDITQYNSGYTKRYKFSRDTAKSGFEDGSIQSKSLYYGNQNRASAAGLYLLNNDVSVGDSEYFHFDRWYSIDLNKEDISGRHYIFILRPDLNLVNEGTNELSDDSHVASDGFFQYLGSYYPHIITSLTGEFDTSASSGRISESDRKCGSGLGNATSRSNSSDNNGTQLPIHTFIPILTGRAESLQLPDYTIKNYELVQPYTKYTIPYPSSAIESQTGGTFDITFREDGEFTIHKLFHAWIYYMDGVMRNKFKPKNKYILYNAFDYATSIYDIAVDATGENIIWFTKYTGCFPLTSPNSDLSFNLHSSPEPKCSIPFAYFMCEQNNLNSLMDFNYNSLGYTYMRRHSYSFSDNGMDPSVPVEAIYNQTVGYSKSFLGRQQVGRPVIFANTKEKILKLRWMPYTAI